MHGTQLYRGNLLRPTMNGVLRFSLWRTRMHRQTSIQRHTQTSARLRSSGGIALLATQATGRVLLLMHGLSMNDLQWHTQSNSHNGEKERVQVHGMALATARKHTPVCLRHSSSLRIARNGYELFALLEQLASHLPRPINERTFVSHSIGGIARTGRRLQQGGVLTPQTTQSTK